MSIDALQRWGGDSWHRLSPPHIEERFWLVAGVATIPLAWWLLSSHTSKNAPQSHQMRTDFNSFLRVVGEPNVPAAKPPSKPKHAATSFLSFIKNVEDDEPPARDSTSFSSFLRSSNVRSTSAAAASLAVAAAPEGPTMSSESIPLTVLFGTEFGFSKEIAEKLCAQLLASAVPYWCVTSFPCGRAHM